MIPPCFAMLYYASSVMFPPTTLSREMFDRLDQDMDGILDKAELNSFEMMSEGCEMDDAVYDWVMAHFDNRKGGITEDGFVALFQYMFEASGNDPETVWKDLKFMGYNNALELNRARTFVMSIHANHDIAMTKVSFDADAFEEAMELPIKQFGTSQLMDDGKIKLYTRKAGYWGVAFAVENLGAQDLEFTLDCGGSNNVVSHRGALKYTEFIPPGETKVLHHLMPSSLQPWSWKYSAMSKWM